MKKLLFAFLAALCVSTAYAQEPPAENTEKTGTPIAIDVTADETNQNEVVAVGHDATLAEGEKAVSVVAVLGSATSAGEVSDSVVSVLGNTHVTGPVANGAVAVFGNVYVNSRIGGEVVAVFGNVELGPKADIGGNVVAIGGNLERDPAAVVRGSVEKVLGGVGPESEHLHPWIKKCLLYGRPLAIAPGLGWAWALAFSFLALYVLFALLFRSGIDRCVQTLETNPGRSILAALLTLLLTPVLFVLLVITIIGIAVVPFLGLGLFIATLFGKAVMLAWIGKRFTKPFGDGPFAHPAVAVLIGGAVVLALYLVPIVGFIVYKVLGVLGLGVVVYTLILGSQRKRVPVTLAAAAATPAAAATQTQEQTQTPEVTTITASDATALPRAGFWIRMGALFLDLVLVGVILAIVHDAGKVTLLALAVYGAIMWKFRGSTIGGIICNLKVVRLDGRPIDWPTAIVRALGCFLSLAIAGLGFFWIAFDEEKQAWHDKIAGTVVVRSPKGVSLV